MVRFRKVTLACLLVGAALPAVAGSSASASFTRIKFQLTDLTPDDGVAASFGFLNGENSTSARLWVDDAAAYWQALGKTQTLDAWMAPMSGSLAADGAGAITTWDVTSDAMSITGIASGLGGQYQGEVSSGPLLDHYWLRNLALSGNAALSIELFYSLDVAAGNAPACTAEQLCAPGVGLGYNTETAGASVGVALSYSYQEDGLSVSYSKHFGDMSRAVAVPRIDVGAYVLDEGLGEFVVNESVIPGSDEFKHSEGVFRLSFFNLSQQQQTANLKISAQVWGQGNTPAVPEPHLAFLCLAGLSVVGQRAIRQRAR